MNITFAIIRERKSPPDKRVVLTPKSCLSFIESFPEAKILIESSDVRAFSDKDYRSVGLKVSNNIKNADIMIGVKEVPIESLIPNKSYFFFSHTIKKQPYNRKLLKAILEKNITLYDHETLVDHNNNRLIGFGYYAGVVGAYNCVRTIGLKTNCFNIPKACDLDGRHELDEILKDVNLPNLKIVLTGTGRVGQGAKEILDHMQIREVNVQDFLSLDYDETVYVQLDVLDYVKRNDGLQSSKSDFFKNPFNYQSIFSKFTEVSDVFIAGHFYGKGSPHFFNRDDAKSSRFKIKVVADISCDINGPIGSTIRSSTISSPIYGYDPETDSESDYNTKNSIAVMAVDNLPCELPKDSSEEFGKTFINKILPAFFNGDSDGILFRSKMTENGKLTPKFSYLQKYVDGIE